MAAQCPDCSEPIDVWSEGQPPPWCRKCGADLRKARAATAAAPPVWPSGPATGAAGVPLVGSPIQYPAEPEAVREFDEKEPLAVHELSLTGFFQKMSPALMIAGIFLLIGGLLGSLAFTRPNAGTTAPALVMLAIAAATLIYPVVMYATGIRRVEIFAEGIRWESRRGVGRMAWGDVEAVYRLELVINGFPKSELTLVGRGAREVVFDKTIDRFQELAGFIQGHCADLIMARKRSEARSGAADFGPIVVGLTGVSMEGWLIPWQSVTSFGVSRGWLWFVFEGRGQKGISLAEIPNYLVLLRLLAELAPPAVPEASGVRVTAG